MLIITGTTTIMTISGVALLYNILQRELLYPSNWPMGSRKFVSKPSEYGIPYSEIKLFTKDNVRLRAFVCKQPIDREAKKRPTIIMFHGNGGNMGHRLPIARIFYLELNYNVILLSYRGYGRSEGTPAEKGLRIDAQQKLIPHLIPKFSFLRYFSFLCWQNWRSENSIQKIKIIPILFLSGTKDEIIPQEHMKGLFELTKTSGGKEWLEFSNGNHNNTNSQPGYFQYIRKFVKRYIDLDEA
ncbi:Alpha/Beta hydrolase protein [Rhizophagus irregularis DAOM 181602=DAOM 197198]|uniref:Alpha/Beta hydrolase protein n=1 Tax=Rhizophagus irregularis (strain DAOM 181602 / DAOM 197198 / MUCL 43194) TaxID=747089 RepID=A0A2P4Q4F7_RHIID|nr:Alpha/Beta hydrolase protein [Rhizophagus irregularis DAOM 181602=DAOM 197198]POG72545.1 Alpha/Beta hydrolase protein [Rhizophagus irregularis DAOM 181602=DAOM 197198]|eukprot:XP_025179411.1 Alpha/Beta hydrolase protein [Rhizophagus irregularis DAOM 181602=DAOM 197198]